MSARKALILRELTNKFGGATSFSWAPGDGLWRDGGRTEHDNIAVVEVMAGALDREYWRVLRNRLVQDLDQEEIVIRAQEVVTL